MGTDDTENTTPEETTTETPAEEATETAEATETETPAEETEAKGEEPAKKDGEAEEKPEDKHRRAGGWQRKIERLERQNQMLVEQLSATRPTQPQTPAPTDKAKDPSAQVEEYVSNLVAQRLAAEREQERHARAQAEFQRRTQEVRAANPDFDEVVMSANVPVSQALQQALLTSEQGPAIMYQLASNPAELARLSALPPLDAAREIGRLEAKASSTPAPEKPKPASRPPAPPTNAGGTASASRGSLESLPIAEYKRAFRSKR
jgi:hypothetical protein